MTGDDHSIISPAILYFGTPVVLLSSRNEEGTDNIAPMSSAWWLGHSCMLGLDASSKTTENMLRTKQCVLNMPDDTMVDHVNKLACTTGSDPVTLSKEMRNYRYVKNKWAEAGLTPQASDFVEPARIYECPVQMECEVVQQTSLRPDLPDRTGLLLAIEVRVLRIHIRESLRMKGYANRICPDKWRPLIMSFQQFYSLRDGQVAPSILGGSCEEEMYRPLTKSDVVKLPGDNDDEIRPHRSNGITA